MEMSRNYRRGLSRRLAKAWDVVNLICARDAPFRIKSTIGNHLLKSAAPAVRAPHLLPLKHVRLQELAAAGFNCLKFRYWLRGALDVRELEDFKREHPAISLRTFTEEQAFVPPPKLPVAYTRSDWDFIVSFCRQNNEKYHTLVNEAFPISDSLLAGNIVLLDAYRYFVSCFEGGGTPRDVDDKDFSELKVYQRLFSEAPPDWAPKELAELAGKLRTFRQDFRPMAVEFSLYPYPVGIYHRPEMVWEWRCVSVDDLIKAFGKLIVTADSCQLNFLLAGSPKASP